MNCLNSACNVAFPGFAMNVGVGAPNPVEKFYASLPLFTNISYTMLMNLVISDSTGTNGSPSLIIASAIYRTVAVSWVIY